MIDDGETDWKLLGIDVNDPAADKLNGLIDPSNSCIIILDVEDIEKYMKGYLAVPPIFLRSLLNVCRLLLSGSVSTRFLLESRKTNLRSTPSLAARS